MVLVLSLMLLACVPQTSLAQSAPRGEIRIVDKDPLNWLLVTWQVFEHLVEFDPDGTLAPRFASSWRWLDDRTIEFKLRKGVNCHIPGSVRSCSWWPGGSGGLALDG